MGANDRRTHGGWVNHQHDRIDKHIRRQNQLYNPGPQQPPPKKGGCAAKAVGVLVGLTITITVALTQPRLVPVLLAAYAMMAIIRRLGPRIIWRPRHRN